MAGFFAHGGEFNDVKGNLTVSRALETPRPKGVTHFRILIIGSANAGKTTILEKVCHATGLTPIISGNQTLSDLKPSLERGEHNIETEFTYPTALGFVFHDSCGFEAGTSNEIEQVKSFINTRAKETSMDNQLHAIWYCLSTSSDRPLTEAEMSLFEIGTGDVPVIAIFTKMDALDKKAFNELINQGKSIADARAGKTALAQTNFQQHYLNRLQRVSHHPAHIIQLRDMNNCDTSCDELIEKTGEALNLEALRLLYASVLRNNLDFCIQCAVDEVAIALQRLIGPFSQYQQKDLLHTVMTCFPHVLFKLEMSNLVKNAREAAKVVMGKIQASSLNPKLKKQEPSFAERLKLDLKLKKEFDTIVSECFNILLPLLPSMIGSTPSHCKVLMFNCIIIAVLVESCFLPLELPFQMNFHMALHSYKDSSKLNDLKDQATKLQETR